MEIVLLLYEWKNQSVKLNYISLLPLCQSYLVQIIKIYWDRLPSVETHLKAYFKIDFPNQK